MNCERYNEYIMKYMDGVITEAEQIELDKHLKQCNACNLEFSELKSIVSVLEEEIPIEPPADFENTVMKKINALNIYDKKQRRKKVLISYFMFGFAFWVVSLMFAVFCRESILGLMLGVGLPESFSYSVYGLLTRIDLLIAFVVYGTTSLKSAFSDFYYLLIGLFVIVLMSKMYEINSVRLTQKGISPSQPNGKK
ncbi:zf-HC2 domain-containing protein [Acetivibrio mesophilus]|uniref:zf-HC2 domain-containing protein n=1 Tax=Acetivibrio mesophilus TaxID=2487273 RepID=UPI000840CABA|nr:zf-HC2 domain-containing protein [Acetivibrio mesophilus]ODM27524.1 hypothetical protein A7W90_15595 [Clostridium sp. Bc-iso-3]